MAISLRDYQLNAVESLRSAYRDGARRPLLQLPTGGGKTVVFCYVAQSAVSKGVPVLVLVHREELLTQCSRKLTELGVHHGLIAPGYSRTPDPVQVASVQTLIRRMSTMTWRPGLIIVDEAHHSCAGSWRKVLSHYEDARALGVTATPCRMDGRGLGDVYDRLITGPDTKWLMDHHFLSQYTLFCPPISVDLSGVRTSGGDYNRGDLSRAVDKPTITGDAVTHYAKHLNGAPSLAFCVSIAHAEHVASQFNAAGYVAKTIDGNMDKKTRAQYIADLGAGKINVLTSCDVVSEGTDIPIVTGAILLRPTKSLGLYLQQVGRVLRPAPGKARAIIMDHVGNVLKHGLPDDDREWTLEARAVRKRVSKEAEDALDIKQCPNCFAVHKTAPTCPACGWVYAASKTAPKQVDGELQEVDRECLRVKQRQEVSSARTQEDLEKIAKARGYKSGWVKHLLESRGQQYKPPAVLTDIMADGTWSLNGQ